MRLINSENCVDRTGLVQWDINELSHAVQMVRREKCGWDKNAIRRVHKCLLCPQGDDEGLQWEFLFIPSVVLATDEDGGHHLGITDTELWPLPGLEH